MPRIGVYFVNWQRKVSVDTYEGHVAVVKTNKPTKTFHEFLLVAAFCLVAVLFGHPARPNAQAFSSRGEGNETRMKLAEIGIATPRLYFIAKDRIVEEFIEGGDLYRMFRSGSEASDLAYQAGFITAAAHQAGLVFTDNKSQNYLIRENKLLRTDLSFVQETQSIYARSVDVGSFLASVIDLDSYAEIQDNFFRGYKTASGRGFPYLSIILRNVLCVGFSSRPSKTAENMMLDTDRFICA